MVFKSSQNWRNRKVLIEGLAWPELCRCHWKFQRDLDVHVLWGSQWGVIFGYLNSMIRVRDLFKYNYDRKGGKISLPIIMLIHLVMGYLREKSRAWGIFACGLRLIVGVKSLVWSRRPVAVPSCLVPVEPSCWLFPGCLQLSTLSDSGKTALGRRGLWSFLLQLGQNPLEDSKLRCWYDYFNCS